MLKVHAICYYRGMDDGWPDAWRETDFKVHNLVEAVRNGDVRGDDDIQMAGGQSTALQFASQFLVKAMHNAGYDKATIIPVPSTTHVTPEGNFTSLRIAQAVAEQDDAFTCAPALYFAKPVPQSPVGGRRTATAIRVNLRSEGLGALGRVVLLDDIATTGAHLKAAAAYLADKGIKVEDAFVVARLADHAPDNMFRVPELILAP